MERSDIRGLCQSKGPTRISLRSIRATRYSLLTIRLTLHHLEPFSQNGDLMLELRDTIGERLGRACTLSPRMKQILGCPRDPDGIGLAPHDPPLEMLILAGNV